MFHNLTFRSEYSLLHSMMRIKDLVAYAQKHNLPALALCDMRAMYGSFKFFIACKDAGIKPIIGCEIQCTYDGKFFFPTLIYAKNTTGYFQLVRYVSQSQLQRQYNRPALHMNDVLSSSQPDLVILSGSPRSSYMRYMMNNHNEKDLATYLNAFAKLTHGYMQIERHVGMQELDTANAYTLKHARMHGIPIVATSEVLYANKDDADAYEILLCIGTQRVVFEKDRPYSLATYPDFYAKDPKTLEDLYADLPDAIENTQHIVDLCNVEIPYGSLILPAFPIPKGYTENSYLEYLVQKGKDRVREYDQSIVNTRLTYELNIIKKKKYPKYFLFIQDVVNWAKENEIGVGPGRGSAAGSLVAYCLRITDINPLDHNLPFERFLNPERPTPPDIDTDFSDTGRESVVKYITEKYGVDNVAQIITFGTMEARMVVRDVSRAMGNTYATGDRIAKMIPIPKQGKHEGLDKAIEESPELKMAYETEQDTKEIIDISKKLEGLPRHTSVHAAGLIVGDKALIEHVPLQYEPRGDKIITQYDMYSLDLNAVSDNKAIGLVKADILGLRNLSIIDSALKLVYKRTGEKIDIHNVPTTDKKAYDIITKGQTVGIFQLESSGMRRLAKDLRPTQLSDITAMVALYRPGPMDLIPTFIAGKKDLSSVAYLHPDLKLVLQETYGVLVYQEQVIDIAVTLAGFSKSEADLLRMAVGKKKKSLMEKGRVQFIKGCIAKGYTKSLAEEIFGFIEKFASYGFNKSHAASYALIAYWTAYVKANFTHEFMCAVLSAEVAAVTGPAREQKVMEIIEECRQLSIAVLPPDINVSSADFSIDGNTIRFGISAIKNIGSAAAESIFAARSTAGAFTGFNDFLHRVDVRKVNKKAVESLVMVGAFAKWGNRATLLKAYPELLIDAQYAREQRECGQFGLFEDVTQVYTDTFTHIPEMSPIQILQAEKELLGIVLSQDPLAGYAHLLANKPIKKIHTIAAEDYNKTFLFAGIIQKMKIVHTKKDGSEMAMYTLQDGTGSIDAVIFPKSYIQYGRNIAVNTPVVARGKIQARLDEITILIDVIKKLDTI